MEKTNKRKTKEEFEEKSLLAMLLSEAVHFKIIFKTVMKLMAGTKKIRFDIYFTFQNDLTS